MPKVFIKYCLSILAFMPLTLVSQNIDQVLELGNSLMQKKDYYAAEKIYWAAMNMDSSNAEVLYRYGLNQSALNNPRKASRYFYKSYILESDKVHENLSFLLAESYRSCGEYRKARRYYTRAIRPYRRDKKSFEYQKINQAKRAASWADRNEKAEADRKVENLSQVGNTEAAEFSGIMRENTLYYSALRADSMGSNNLVLDKDYLNKIYRLSNKDGDQVQEVKFEAHEELKGKNLANLRFGKADEVFFSVCDSSYRCEIWRGTWQKEQVKNPQKLNANINSAGDNNTQPYWFEVDDQEYLLFVSDRERGFGGLDIWLSKRADFGFEVPINLGGNINSLEDEITPFYSTQSRTLYFSSNWHEGFGGFDIFSAKGGLQQFEKPVNLNKPINSNFDDYYFFSSQGKALLSSNRYEGNVQSGSNCCNDLFALNFEEEAWEETDPEKIEVNVDVLNKYLPLDLYFHNDSPDPNSRDTSTRESYVNLANKYQLMKAEYMDKYGQAFPDSLADDARYEIEDFFDAEVDAGIKSLNFFTPLLAKELAKGSQIELTIKGYASSLSGSDYNLNLTLRRIQSLINYLAAYEGGVLLPYLDKTAKNGGSLKINKLPFGEFAVEDTSINNNRIKAVYSPQASRQRKIEVLAVTKSSASISQLDGSAMEKSAAIQIDKKSWDLGDIKKSSSNNLIIPFQNTGEAPLRIYTVKDNCDCLQIKFPRTLNPGEKGNIQLDFDFNKVQGEAKVILSVFSNTSPNIQEISIRFNNAN